MKTQLIRWLPIVAGLIAAPVSAQTWLPQLPDLPSIVIDPAELEAIRKDVMAAQREATEAIQVQAVAAKAIQAEAVAIARAVAEAVSAELAWPVPVGQRVATPPPAWLNGDPGDSLYRAAREALNSRRFERADSLFGEIRRRFPASGYVPDSYYFQAFALQRLGGRQREDRALSLLVEQLDKYPKAATYADAIQLKVRLLGALAQGGDASAAAAVETAARANCVDEDQELRATALSALTTMAPERALPILREIFKSRDECSVELRRQAVFLVGRMEGDAVVEIMIDVVQRDPDPDLRVRQAALSWLARAQAPAAVSALEAVLNRTTDRKEGEQILLAIGSTSTPRSVEVLKAYVKRADAPLPLRQMALNWLGRDTKNGGPAYLREIYPSLTDVALKEQVAVSLSRSTAAEDRAWLRGRLLDKSEIMQIRMSALAWVLRGADMKASDLRSLYWEVDDLRLRGEILAFISRSDESAAVDALIDIASKETDKELRQNAIRYLGRRDDRRVAEFLLKVIKGEAR